MRARRINDPFQVQSIEHPRVQTLLAGAGLTLALLLALMPRVRHLTQECAWYDELITIRHLGEPTLATFLARVREFNEPVPPLYFTLEYYWAHLFGPSTLGLRLLSVGIGLASIVALFELTKRLFGYMAGVLAAFCLAVNYQHIVYSQEIRMYVLVGLLAVLSVRSFVCVLAKGSKTAQWVSALLNLLLVWTQPMSALLPLLEGVNLCVFRRRQWRQHLWWFFLHALVAVSIVLWYSTRSQVRLAELLSWIEVPTLRSLERFFMIVLGVERTHLGATVPLLLIAAALFTWKTCGRGSSLFRSSAGDTPEIGVLMTTWLFVPPAVVFCASYLCKPCFVDRYLLFTCFPAYIILGAVAACLKPPRARAVACAALLIGMVGSAFSWPNGPNRLPLPEIAAPLCAEATPGSVVLLSNPLPSFRDEVQYYVRRSDLALVNLKSTPELPNLIPYYLKQGLNVWIVTVDAPKIKDVVREAGFTFTLRSWPGKYDAELMHIVAPS